MKLMNDARNHDFLMDENGRKHHAADCWCDPKARQDDPETAYLEHRGELPKTRCA